MEESSITCAKFINADIAFVICAPERGAVSPNFPHLLSPDQQGDSSCPTDRAAVCDRPDEQLTAFVELESATQRRGELA